MKQFQFVHMILAFHGSLEYTQIYVWQFSGSWFLVIAPCRNLLPWNISISMYSSCDTMSSTFASHQPDRNTNRIASFNTKSPVLSANLPGIIMVYLCLLTAIFDSPVFFSFYLPRWATCNYERKWTVTSHTYHIDKKPRIALVCRF